MTSAPPSSTRIRGALAEELAARHLECAGLRIVERNYRCRFGEIDLIAWHGQSLVFVEVRHRASPGYGGAAGSITPAKQRRLLQTARHYLGSLRKTPPCRFDAVLVTGSKPEIKWLQHVFEE